MNWTYAPLGANRVWRDGSWTYFIQYLQTRDVYSVWIVNETERRIKIGEYRTLGEAKYAAEKRQSKGNPVRRNSMKRGSGIGKLITFAAVGVGGYLIYKHFFSKTALASQDIRPALPTVVTTPDGAQYWYGGSPTSGYANRVWLDAAGNPQQAGPPSSARVGWPWNVAGAK